MAHTGNVSINNPSNVLPQIPSLLFPFVCLLPFPSSSSTRSSQSLFLSLSPPPLISLSLDSSFSSNFTDSSLPPPSSSQHSATSIPSPHSFFASSSPLYHSLHQLLTISFVVFSLRVLLYRRMLTCWDRHIWDTMKKTR